MSHKVTLLPGDGIGPEVTAAMRVCVEATGVKIDWDVQEVGEKSMARHGKPLHSAVEKLAAHLPEGGLMAFELRSRYVARGDGDVEPFVDRCEQLRRLVDGSR